MVSTLEAAVCVGFYTGIEMLLAYRSPTDLAVNIRSKADEGILSLIDSHSDYGPQQTARNRLKGEPYSPFWEALSSSSLSSTVLLSAEWLENNDTEADDEIYNGFTPMAMCRLV
jgi:hypothetical protein